MNFPNGKLDSKSKGDDQILIPKWSPQYPMYDGDASPCTPGTYYANLKTPDGSMFKRYYHTPENTLIFFKTIFHSMQCFVL